MEQQPLGPQPSGQANSGGETAQSPANAEFKPSFEPVSEKAPAPGEVRTDSSAPAPPAVVQPVTPPTAALPLAPQPVVANNNPKTADANPKYADNVDVIEREWVQRAKQIVLDTKNSPYQREVEVGKLQADYLQKRYGKQIKIANE